MEPKRRSKTIPKSYKKQDAFSEGQLGEKMGWPADVGVVSGGGGGLASDFVSPSGSCLTRPFHAKDVGGGSKAHATAAGPLWKECDCDKDVTRFNLGTLCTSCVLAGGVVGVLEVGFDVFLEF